MPLSVGTDIIEIKRIAALLERWPEKFRHKIFTASEIAYCQARKNQAQHFAARFAAKEALIKALAVAKGGGISLRDIEIKNQPAGAPFINLTGALAELAARQKVQQITISLSHCQEYALAVVIVEKE